MPSNPANVKPDLANIELLTDKEYCFAEAVATHQYVDVPALYMDVFQLDPEGDAFPEDAECRKPYMRRARGLANALLRKPNVKRIIDEIQAQNAELCQVDRPKHLRELMRISELAIANNQMNAAVGAQKLIGMTFGLYTETRRIEGQVEVNVSSEQVEKRLIQLLRDNPELLEKVDHKQLPIATVSESIDVTPIVTEHINVDA